MMQFHFLMKESLCAMLQTSASKYILPTIQCRTTTALGSSDHEGQEV